MKIKNTKWFVVGFVLVLVTVILSYLTYKSFQKEKYDLTLAFGADIKGLDPTQEENTGTVVGNDLFRCIHDTLIGTDIQTGELTYNLATKYEKNDKNVKFKLREDAYFHNGEKVTYEDVEFSVKQGQKNQHPQFKNIKEMKKLDNNEFEVILENDILNWQFAFTNFIRILNKKAIEKDPDKGIKIGTGPYKLKQWRRKEFISLERFNKYYNKDFCKEGQEKVLIQIIEDPDTSLTQLEQEKIDAIIGYPTAKINNLKNNKSKNIKIVEGDTFSCNYFYINKESTSEKVRKAIALALDVPKYLQELKLPVTPLESYIPKGLIGYDESLKHHQTNFEEARNIVNHLQLTEKKLKLVTYKGRPLEVPNKITEALREVGFEAELEQLEFNTLLEKSNKGDKGDNSINISFIGESHETLYGGKAIEDYFSGDNKYNFCHVDQTDAQYLKEKIDQMNQTNDLVEYQNLVQGMVKYIHDKFYVVPLYSSKNYNLTTNKIEQGLKFDKFSCWDITKIKKIKKE